MATVNLSDAAAIERMHVLHDRARRIVDEARHAGDHVSVVGRIHKIVDELARALTELDGLREAMRTRATIEQAKGVVMSVRGCGPDEAFDQLVGLSQTSQAKLHDIASNLVRQVATGGWSFEDLRKTFGGPTSAMPPAQR